ncbi:GNAT family N-acetyltransferase [Psychromonas sp.]|uniref:GNAT family N-acetyltransferase n=1 Tax=Psychromonas sp. TaxID=1884585 RepID=UPI00356872C3
MKLFAENQHLAVRQFTISDLEDFIKLAGNAKTMKFCPAGKLSRKQAESMFNNILSHAQRSRYNLCAIADKESNKVIGLVGLQECCVGDDVALNFVYRTLPEYFENTPVKSLFAQFISYLVVTHQLAGLDAVIARKNQQSVALMESLNFKLIGKVVCRGIDSFLYRYSPQ